METRSRMIISFLLAFSLIFLYGVKGGPCRDYVCRDLEEHYHIEYSRIQAVLVNQKEHRFYFVALNVYDGGGVHTLTLNRFFTDFHLDPKEFLDFVEPYIVEIVPDWMMQE